MAYRGSTYELSSLDGGMVFSNNHDGLNPSMIVEGSYNIEYAKGGRKNRGGTGKVNPSVLSGTPEILGGFDYKKANGSEFLLLNTSDGKLWKDYISTLDTGYATNVKSHFEKWNDKVYIFNGVNAVKYWDGITSGLTTMTKIPNDWTGSNQPKWGISHGSGKSTRAWFGGCANNPNLVYISDSLSAGEDPDLSESCLTIMVIETGEKSGIIGGVEFGKQLILFSISGAFFINDSAADPANWSYTKAPWVGGVLNQDLIIKIENDVICMGADGNIYSIQSIFSSKDYEAASISKAVFLNDWVQENLDWGASSEFFGIYDPSLRAVKIWVTKISKTQNTLCLVYFIDKSISGMNRWSMYQNSSNPSAYTARSAFRYITGSNRTKIYTGSYDGWVWETERTKKINDDGKSFYAGFTSPNLPFDSSRNSKNIAKGWVSSQAVGNYDLGVKVKIDAVLYVTTTVSMQGSGALWGSRLWGTGTWAGFFELLDKRFPIRRNGKRFQIEVWNSTLDQMFFISQIRIDFNPQGKTNR